MEDDDSYSEGLGFTYEDAVEMDRRYREAHTFIIECDSITFGPTHDKADGTHFGSGVGGPVVWAGPPGCPGGFVVVPDPHHGGLG